MEYNTVVTEAEYKSEFEPTKYIPYLSLTGELWDVFCKDFEGNWPRYNGTALYISTALTIDTTLWFRSCFPYAYSVQNSSTNKVSHSNIVYI